MVFLQERCAEHETAVCTAEVGNDCLVKVSAVVSAEEPADIRAEIKSSVVSQHRWTAQAHSGRRDGQQGNRAGVCHSSMPHDCGSRKIAWLCERRGKRTRSSWPLGGGPGSPTAGATRLSPENVMLAALTFR